MKHYFILLCTLLTIGCSKQERKSEEVNYQPWVPFDSVVQDMPSLGKYLTTVVMPDLNTRNYIIYDSMGSKLTTEQFLKRFSSGNYLPLKVKSVHDTLPIYQLHSVESDENMSKMIQAIGGQFLSFNHLIGGDLPNYYFVDLDGKEYSSRTMDGKWVVVKLGLLAVSHV